MGFYFWGVVSVIEDMWGKLLAGSNVYLSCCELRHKIRHYPTIARNERDTSYNC